MPNPIPNANAGLNDAAMPQQAADPMSAMLGGGAPATAPTGGDPLQEIAEAGMNMEEQKEAGKETLDPETLKQIMMTGDNTDGMFQPDKSALLDENDKEHEEVDEDAEVKTKGKVDKKGRKYVKLLTKDMKSRPDDFEIDTPRGRMSLAKAMQLGYNPLSGEFDQESSEDMVNRVLGDSNDADRDAIAKLINPQSAQVAPADASMYGLAPDSPMVRQSAQGAPAAAPMPAEGMPSEAIPQGALPEGLPPEAEQTAAPQGGQNIAALLGGGNI